jgi:hypothetical protein
LKKRQTAYWFEYLSDQKLVHLQYNVDNDRGAETLAKFCARLFPFIDDHDVRRLVTDLRWNGGGNNFRDSPDLLGASRAGQQDEEMALAAWSAGGDSPVRTGSPAGGGRGLG